MVYPDFPRGSPEEEAGRSLGSLYPGTRQPLALAGLEGGQFVLVLLFLAANELLLQKTLRQVSAPNAECDC